MVRCAVRTSVQWCKGGDFSLAREVVSRLSVELSSITALAGASLTNWPPCKEFLPNPFAPETGCNFATTSWNQSAVIIFFISGFFHNKMSCSLPVSDMSQWGRMGLTEWHATQPAKHEQEHREVHSLLFSWKAVTDYRRWLKVFIGIWNY